MPRANHVKNDHFMKAAEAAAAAERAIQKKIDQKEARRTKKPKKGMGAMQAGARVYPECRRCPNQHLPSPERKPISSSTPMYDAPHYKGSDKLPTRWR